MLGILLGIVLLALVLVAVLPQGFGWLDDFLTVLRGAIPVLAAIFGVCAILIGVADIADKKEAQLEAEISKRASK